MSVEIVDDEALWDRFVDASPNSMLFHKRAFLNLQEKYTGDKLLPYGIFAGNDLTCILPVFLSKQNGLRLLYSPPRSSLVYVPYLGPATSPAIARLQPHDRESAWRSIIGELCAEFSRLSPNYVALGLSPGFLDVRPFERTGYEADLMYTYIIDLERPVQAIWESIESDTKKSIKDASRHPLTIAQATDTATFTDLMRQGLKSQGETFFHRQSPEYLTEILEAFPDHVRMYFLYLGEDLIGANTLCSFHGHCIGWMGNTAARQGFSANDYLVWEMLKKVKQEGCRTFENTGADEKRLNHSKTKFNPALVPWFYLYKRDPLYRTAKLGQLALGKIKRHA
ncbi:GNAT family N-acetyltransferase [Methanocella sp. MCL-LM]|uniref:GNAT family N-acetyltransferase n=1 Tax=Methanocella sp. MCL-LM TaxID=3412035 RepID=UPI003C746AE3